MRGMLCKETFSCFLSGGSRLTYRVSPWSRDGASTYETSPHADAEVINYHCQFIGAHSITHRSSAPAIVLHRGLQWASLTAGRIEISSLSKMIPAPTAFGDAAGDIVNSPANRRSWRGQVPRDGSGCGLCVSLSGHIIRLGSTTQAPGESRSFIASDACMLGQEIACGLRHGSRVVTPLRSSAMTFKSRTRSLLLEARLPRPCTESICRDFHLLRPQCIGSLLL